MQTRSAQMHTLFIGLFVSSNKTDAIFKAYCDIGSASTTAQHGNNITVLAEGFAAERLTTGVQLQGCVELK